MEVVYEVELNVIAVGVAVLRANDIDRVKNPSTVAFRDEVVRRAHAAPETTRADEGMNEESLVELVLANPRVDQGAPAVHGVLAFGKAPALPALALGPRCERAVEAVRDDGLRNVDRDPPELVDQRRE